MWLSLMETLLSGFSVSILQFRYFPIFHEKWNSFYKMIAFDYFFLWEKYFL